MLLQATWDYSKSQKVIRNCYFQDYGDNNRIGCGIKKTRTIYIWVQIFQMDNRYRINMCLRSWLLLLYVQYRRGND